MRYFILILMAIMSVSICTAGGFTHSESIHHVPKIEKYKLKKEKKERKLTGKQIVKIMIPLLLAGILTITAVIDIEVVSLMIYMLYFVSLSAMAFYPDVKSGTIFIFFLLGIGIPLLGYALGINTLFVLIYGMTFVTAPVFFILFLISLGLNNKKKTNSKL